MNEDVALGVKLRRLLATAQNENFRQDVLHEATLDEEIEAAHACGGEEDFHQLVADALGAHVVNVASVFEDGGPCFGFDFKIEHCSETDGAEQAEFVFPESRDGIADGANEAGTEIGAARDVIYDFATNGIVKEAVDGEVAALGIGLRVAEGDFRGATTIHVCAVASKSGDLKVVSVFVDDDDAEMRADGVGAREERLHLLGACIGGDVVVMRFEAEEHVAHASTGIERAVAGLAEAADERTCGGFK